MATIDIGGAAGSVRGVGGLLTFEFQPSIGILANRMAAFGAEFDNLREPLVKSVQKVMIPSFRANFAAQGRPAWEELSPVTVKRRNGETGPILRRTGRLEKDATSTKIWHFSTTAASIQTWPSSSWYGALHQGGYGQASKATVAQQTSAGAAAFVIPARPFIMFQEEDVPKIQEVFADWMTEQALKHGWVIT